MTEAPLKAFISYSHKDKRARDTLEVHLKALARTGDVSAWSDRLISAGDALDDAIGAELAESQIVFLLVSADFIASDYCYGVEMTAALAGHADGSKTVVPIILAPCDWKNSPFSHLKVLPEDGKPICDFTPRSKGYDQVVKAVRELVKRRRASISDARKPPTTKEARKARKPSSAPWLNLLNVEQAHKNCRLDHYRDWYRDPWNWPEWQWLTDRDPSRIIRFLDAPAVSGWSSVDVAKEGHKVRPGVVLQPLQRLAYQALVDAVSVQLIGRLRPWVFGMRLSVRSPSRGSYARGDVQARYMRERLNLLSLSSLYALRMDVEDFFPSIDHTRLLRQIELRTQKRGRTAATALQELVGNFASSGIEGLPQRYIPSSVLANLFLVPVDDVLDEFSGPSHRLWRPPRVVRWMDDIWVFGRKRSEMERASAAAKDALAAVGLTPSPSKTRILAGEELVQTATSFELSAIDQELEQDSTSSQHLDELLGRIESNPTMTPRTWIVFATTRMRKHSVYDRAESLFGQAHLMLHAADSLARLFRDSGTYRRVTDQYLDVAKRYSAASGWAVAQLSSMFPSNVAPEQEVQQLMLKSFFDSGSLSLFTLASQRLASWKHPDARERMRHSALESDDPLISRACALTDLSYGVDRKFVTKLLGDHPDCDVTRSMIEDRAYRRYPVTKDFAGRV